MPMMESEVNRTMESGGQSFSRGLATRIRRSFMARKKKNQVKKEQQEERRNVQHIESSSESPSKPLLRSASLEKLPKRKDSFLSSPSIPKKKQNRKISLPFVPLSHHRKTSVQAPVPEIPSPLEQELANQENQSPNDPQFQRKVSRQWQENMLLSQTRRFCPQTAGADTTKSQLFHALQKQANFHWPTSPSQQCAFQRQVSGTPQTFSDSPMLSPSPFLSATPFRRNGPHYASMPAHRVAFQELPSFQRGVPQRCSARNSPFQNTPGGSSPFQSTSRGPSPFRSTSRGPSPFRSASRAPSPTHATSPFFRKTTINSSVREPRVRKQGRQQFLLPEINACEIKEKTRKISLHLPSLSAVSSPSQTRKVSFNFSRDKGKKEGKVKGKRARPQSIDDTIVVKIQQAVKREQFAAETIGNPYIPTTTASLSSASPQPQLRRLSIMIRRSMKKHRRCSSQTPSPCQRDHPTLTKSVSHHTAFLRLSPPPTPSPSSSASSSPSAIWYDNFTPASSPTPSTSASLSPSSATSIYSFSSLFDMPSSSDASSARSCASISTSSSSSTFQDIFVTQPEIAEKFAIMFPSEPRPEWHRHLRSMLHKAGQKIFRKQSEAHDTTIPEDLRYQLKQIYVY